MVDPHDKIAAIVDSKELDSKKVGAAAKDATDDDYKTSTSITKELERVRDNVKFYNKIQEKPQQKNDRHDYNKLAPESAWQAGQEFTHQLLTAKGTKC